MLKLHEPLQLVGLVRECAFHEAHGRRPHVEVIRRLLFLARVEPLKPFSTVLITDPNGGNPTETVTIRPSKLQNGMLSDPSSATDGGTFQDGVYTATGTARAVILAIDGLVFSPTQREVIPGQTVTTNFAITDVNSEDATTTAAASVIVTTLNYVNGPSDSHALLKGTSGQDVINTFGVATTTPANGGNDFIIAGAGQAVVNVSGGSTTTALGGDRNLVEGGNGSNTVTGGPGGLNTVFLGNGNNVVQLGGELRQRLYQCGGNRQHCERRRRHQYYQWRRRS